jgi:hypothetical protein
LELPRPAYGAVLLREPPCRLSYGWSFTSGLAALASMLPCARHPRAQLAALRASLRMALWGWSGSPLPPPSLLLKTAPPLIRLTASPPWAFRVLLPLVLVGG